MPGRRRRKSRCSRKPGNNAICSLTARVAPFLLRQVRSRFVCSVRPAEGKHRVNSFTCQLVFDILSACSIGEGWFCVKRIGVGIIGWGFMGKTHAHGLREMPLFYPGAAFRAEIVSVCSRRIGAAKEAAELLGAAHFTDDYRELLARDDVDVVSVCTPNEMHEEMVLAAIAAGKDIYLDKPVASSYASALRMADAADRAGTLCQVVLNNRFFPATMRAKQLMDEGRIGEITGFRFRYLHSGSLQADRPVGWKQLSGAGVLHDLGSHALDLMTWLCGQPESVSCHLRTLYENRPTPGGGVTDQLGDDHALMVLTLPSGAVGTVEASKIWTGSDDELAFEIAGTEGALRFDAMNPNYLEFFDQRRPDGAYGGERGYVKIACVAHYDRPAGQFLPPKNTIGWDRAHMHCYYRFLDAVAKGDSPNPSLRDGANLQRLMEACAVSHREGRQVAL